jgi:hypothetical protein
MKKSELKALIKEVIQEIELSPIKMNVKLSDPKEVDGKWIVEFTATGKGTYETGKRVFNHKPTDAELAEIKRSKSEIKASMPDYLYQGFLGNMKNLNRKG